MTIARALSRAWAVERARRCAHGSARGLPASRWSRGLQKARERSGTPAHSTIRQNTKGPDRMAATLR
jgi:hypothetical protein